MAIEDVQYRLKALNLQSNELSRDLVNLREFLQENMGRNSTKCLLEGADHKPLVPEPVIARGMASDEKAAVFPDSDERPKITPDLSVREHLVRDYIVGLEHITTADHMKPMFRWGMGRKGGKAQLF